MTTSTRSINRSSSNYSSNSSSSNKNNNNKDMKKLEYRKNLLQRLDGEENLDFAILTLCDKIMNDPSLKVFYKMFDNDNLYSLQKEYVTLALTVRPKDCNAKSKLALRHYRLFDMGLTQVHLDKVAKHFVNALKDSWADEDAIEDVMKCLGSFRFLNAVTNDTNKGLSSRSIMKAALAEGNHNNATGAGGGGLLEEENNMASNSRHHSWMEPENAANVARRINDYRKSWHAGSGSGSSSSRRGSGRL